MTSKPKDAQVPGEILQGTLLCARCNQKTPVHALWFKVSVPREGQLTVAKAVCDQCLEASAAVLEADRCLRMRQGQRATLVRVALL